MEYCLLWFQTPQIELLINKNLLTFKNELTLFCIPDLFGGQIKWIILAFWVVEGSEESSMSVPFFATSIIPWFSCESSFSKSPEPSSSLKNQSICSIKEK